MRHQVAVKKIGKDRKHRMAILRNLSQDLISAERVKTSITKAKALRGFVEPIINRAKNDTIHNRRLVHRNIRDTHLLKKLFEDIGKRYKNRNGGYLRMYKLGRRKGDGTELCLVELVEEMLSSSGVESGSKANAAAPAKTKKPAAVNDDSATVEAKSDSAENAEESSRDAGQDGDTTEDK